jgi:ActR/RegA family two-component response regulator
MEQPQILIVEDDFLIALDLDQALTAAGWDVRGVAGSQAEALGLAETCRPPYAVVDVHLAPGDGRVVAKELTGRYRTTVLMATAHCNDTTDFSNTGAVGCIPKPYSTVDMLRALHVLQEVRAGKVPSHLPDHMRMFS